MGKSWVVALISVVVLFGATQVTVRGGKFEKRDLTPEEQAAADEARSHIAKVLERNLIKFFTLVAADNGHELFPRQEDDEEAGLDPNILPQVAQILGAIFTGTFNITSVVDRTFKLAPQAIRNQVEGVFKLLTGQKEASTTTEATTEATTEKPKRRRRTTIIPTTANATEEFEEDLKSEASTNISTTSTTNKPGKYRIKPKNRTKTTTASPLEELDFFEEEPELYQLEEKVVQAAIEAEPSVRNKEPRFFLGSVRDILSNLDSGRLNLTQIIRFLPDLFQGARQAFVLLENLGQIAGIDLDDDSD